MLTRLASHCGSQDVLAALRSSQDTAPSLFALTGQSNVSNTKNPLSLIKHAASLGYCTLLDAAALAPTSVMSLSDNPVDAMAVSFYKMFGFPTGVGALIAKESFLERLERPWFAGGTVDVVQAPGTIHTMTATLHERFEVRILIPALRSPPALITLIRFMFHWLLIHEADPDLLHRTAPSTT